MKLDDLEIYQLSMSLSEKIWEIILEWNFFERDTIGKQLIRSADSVSANISEGFGRYFYKENRQFCYYARGSLFETKTWITKAHNRDLIAEEDFSSLKNDIDKIRIKLNNYINTIGKASKHKTTHDNS